VSSPQAAFSLFHRRACTPKRGKISRHFAPVRSSLRPFIFDEACSYCSYGTISFLRQFPIVFTRGLEDRSVFKFHMSSASHFNRYKARFQGKAGLGNCFGGQKISRFDRRGAHLNVGIPSCRAENIVSHPKQITVKD